MPDIVGIKEEHGLDWLDQIPSVIRDRALLCARTRNVAPELAALVAIGSISAAVGKGLLVQSSRNRTTRANLYILLGAPSGAGKSEVFRELYRPLLDFEEELYSFWRQEASPRARAGDELLKGVVAGLRSAGKRMAHPGLDLFRGIQENERKREICRGFLDPPSILADDITPEALMVVMGRSHETLAIVSPDARQTLKALAVSDSRAESFFLKAFSGDLAVSNRISRRAIRLHSPCLSVLLLTQCDAFAHFVGKVSAGKSGLLPRFLYANFNSEHQISGTIDLRRTPSIEKSYDRLIQGLLENYRFAEEPTVVIPTREAMRLLRDYERECRAASAADSTIRGEILRRKTEQVWRLALVLHAARYGRFSGGNQLSHSDAQVALGLVDWLESRV